MKAYLYFFALKQAKAWSLLTIESGLQKGKRLVERRDFDFTGLLYRLPTQIKPRIIVVEGRRAIILDGAVSKERENS